MKIIQTIRDIFRPVLSDKTILKYNKKGLLIRGELSPNQIQPNSIDLTLGNTWKRPLYNTETSEVPFIDPTKEINYEDGLFRAKGNDKYLLLPGEFVLMASNEVLNIPNGILSFVQGRSSIARIGIQTEQAGLIDAGFEGTITFEIYNQGKYPIILYKGMRVAQVYFFKSQYAINPYGSKDKGSKYQLQMDPTGSKIHMDPELK